MVCVLPCRRRHEAPHPSGDSIIYSMHVIRAFAPYLSMHVHEIRGEAAVEPRDALLCPCMLDGRRDCTTMRAR